MNPALTRATVAAALLLLAGCASANPHSSPQLPNPTVGITTRSTVVSGSGQVVTTSATPAAGATDLAIPSTGPAQLAPVSNRHKASAILAASDAYYQQQFQAGVPVILDRGQPNSYPAFKAWYDAHGQGDVQEGMDAFGKADANFTADNEPATISDWRADNGQLSSDIAQLASDGLDVGGPDDANARQKVQADVAQFQKDFKAAEKDVANVDAGK